LARNPEGKRTLGGPRLKGGNIIKMDVREIQWDGTDWIVLAEDRDE
jgi:hypothetical protein